MRSSLVVEDADIEVDLRHLDRVRGRAVEVEAFIVLLSIALVSINHVFRPVLGLGVDAVPASGELDVDFQF